MDKHAHGAGDVNTENPPAFVKQPDDHYLCVKCTRLLRPPVKQTLCGHRLCQSCVDELFRNQEEVPCPGEEEDCVMLTRDKMRPDKAANRELRCLEVYCSNRQHGCQQVVKWGTLTEHEALCPYKTVQYLNQSIAHVQQCTEKLEQVQQATTAHESSVSHQRQSSGLPEGNSRDIMDRINRLETSMGMHDIRIAESDLRFRLLETAAFDGRLIWRIPNYSRRKQDAVESRTLSLYSQPFYSSYYGYKMCARVYLNGDGLGKGSHISMFFVIMKGEYDSLLQWPFRQRFTLSILNQSGNRKHITDTFRPDPTSTSFRRPIGEMNVASGSPLFAPQTKVEAEPYLKDDTIFICVTIDRTDIPEPWI